MVRITHAHLSDLFLCHPVLSNLVLPIRHSLLLTSVVRTAHENDRRQTRNRQEDQHSTEFEVQTRLKSLSVAHVTFKLFSDKNRVPLVIHVNSDLQCRLLFCDYVLVVLQCLVESVADIKIIPRVLQPALLNFLEVLVNFETQSDKLIKFEASSVGVVA